MSKENYLSKFEEEDSSAGIEGLANNKILYADQFTSEVVYDNKGLAMEEVEMDGQKRGVYPRTMKDVYAYFKPSIEMDFVTDEGPVKETLYFKETKDFEINNGKGNLINNSSFLSGLRSRRDNCAKLRKQIELNTRLRTILKDKEGKEELRELLQSILEELNNAK